MRCRANDWRTLSARSVRNNEWRAISAHHVSNNEWCAVSAYHVVVYITSRQARSPGDMRVSNGLIGRLRNSSIWGAFYIPEFEGSGGGQRR